MGVVACRFDMPVLTDSLFSRRRFCGLFLLLTSLAGAADAAPPTGPADTPDSAAALAAQGTRLLRKGLRFERAAEYFAQAAEKDPKNPAYPLALGCALASRSASLAYTAGRAFSLSEARAHFAETVREWEEERETLRAMDPKEFSDADYEKTRPEMPPAREFRTKDDSQPYRLTREQVERRLTDLQTKALAAWESGIALSASPAEKAQAYYIQGWGMRVLSLFLNSAALDDSEEPAVPASVPFMVKGIPKKSEFLAAFGKAIELAPQNPLYWQAKGDALIGRSDAAEDKKGAEKAYRAALERKPRNAAALWYLLYDWTAAKAVNEFSSDLSPKPDTDWPAALDLLRRASARDKGNAWPLYEEAGVLFRDAPYSLTGPSGNPEASEKEKEARRAAVRTDAARKTGRHAIDLITEGNRAARYETPHYADSVPPLLDAVWHYVFPVIIPFSSFARIRELARSAAGYAQFVAESEKQPDEAERAALAVVGMGYRMIGDWPTKDDPATGRTVIAGLVGIAVAGIGYKYAEKVYETLGATGKLTALQAENAAFKKRVELYRKAVTEDMKRDEAD